MDLTPTGFQIKTDSVGANESGANYIYMAIRRPHKPPTSATEVFTVKYLANGSTNLGFVADTNISKYPAGTQEWYWNSRLTGNKDLNSNNSGTEDTAQPTYWDLPTNAVNYGSYTGYHVNYVFRRAPGFFDVVAYTGTGSVTTVNHNLVAVPELILLKGREDTYNWSVYTQALGRDKILYLNMDERDETFAAPAFWGSTDFTSTQFSLGTYWNTNRPNYDYIAYLFASQPGISKIGSYSGTGSDINVDCGFTTGARFVMIKRTDSSGDWYIWDTARGINGANEPYIKLNSTDAEATGTDYIDPLISGFKVTSSAPAEINAAGGEYLFLAIA